MSQQCVATSKQTGKRCQRQLKDGVRVCRYHGGAAPAVKAAAQRRGQAERARRAVATFGLAVEVAPEVALLEEVHRTAGHVAWLAALVAGLDRAQLRQYDQVGLQRPSGWVELYQTERVHLVAVCKAALAAGVEERRVQLAERQGELVAELLTTAVRAAGMSREQEEAAYAAVRGRLARLTLVPADGGTPGG